MRWWEWQCMEVVMVCGRGGGGGTGVCMVAVVVLDPHSEALFKRD